jgi:hypothetical protein
LSIGKEIEAEILMSKKYEDLKPIISKYKKVLVTGPHGAGNKITAHIIAHDLGIPYIRGEETWRHHEYWDPEPRGLLTYHDKMKDKEWSMFAPSQSSHLQNMLEFLDDVLVVFMYKDIDQIKDYSTRNRFVRNHTHSYEWTTHMEIIDKEFPELNYLKNWEIEEMTYFIWETKQRKLIPNWIEIEHSSLEGHELWVPRENRRHFKEWQIRENEAVPSETKEDGQ